MTSSTPASIEPRRARNLATRASEAQAFDVPIASPQAAREAYRRALATEGTRTPLTRPGHRLYWSSADRLGARDLVASADSYIVAGRHTHCDVMLDGDESISLRHALFRSVLDDGCPMLSVVDLQTHGGFELADGSRQRAITATGAVVLRIGSYVVVSLPTGSPLPPDLPPCSQRPLDVRPDSSPVHPYRSPARRGPLAVSRITLMPHAVELGALRATTGESDYELFARSRRGHTAVRVTDADLDRGVLMGRSPKCIQGGLEHVFSIGISRVHLLATRERDGVFVYDVASTTGTFNTWGRPIRRMRLADEGTRICLGSGETAVELHWRKLGPR